MLIVESTALSLNDILCSRHIFNGLYMFDVDAIKRNHVKEIKQQRQEKQAQRL